MDEIAFLFCCNETVQKSIVYGLIVVIKALSPFASQGVDFKSFRQRIRFVVHLLAWLSIAWSEVGGGAVKAQKHCGNHGVLKKSFTDMVIAFLSST